MRRRHCLELSLLAPFAGMAACGGQTPADINVGIATAPGTLDPFRCADAAADRLMRLRYERLVDFDQRFLPVPGMAGWEVLDPLHYRFRLRDSRRAFPDGRLPDADDVVASLRELRFGAQPSLHQGTLAGILAIDRVDALTVDIRLAAPDLLFPGRLSLPVVPAALAADTLARAGPQAGSGPFRLLGGDPQRALLLERRADGARFALVVVADPTVRALKLAHGELDFIQGDLPAELLGWLRGRAGLRVLARPGTTVAYIGFNLRDPRTADPGLRRAFAHGLDRQAIIGHLLAGAARPAASILTPAHWAGLPAGQEAAFDPALARAALPAAASEPLVLRTSTDPARVRIATVFQHQLAALGLDLRLQSNEWGTFFGDVRAGRFQCYSLAWVGLTLPDAFRHIFHSEALPPAGANRGAFADAQCDALIEAALGADTLAGQARHWHALQRRLLELLPCVPLWFEDVVCALGDRMASYAPRADGAWDGLAEAVIA